MRTYKTFAVYPHIGGKYCRCLVFHTKKDMAEYANVTHRRENQGRTMSPDFEAMVIGNRNKSKHHFCEAIFYKAGVDIPTVSHEMVHAALAWGRRRLKVKDTDEKPFIIRKFEMGRLAYSLKSLDVSDEEEEICQCFEHMLSQFIRKYWGKVRVSE